MRWRQITKTHFTNWFPFGRERGSLFGREFLCKSNNSMQGKFPKFRHPRPCARIFSVFPPFCAGFGSPSLLVPRDAINMELFQITINHITCDTETSREAPLADKEKGQRRRKMYSACHPPPTPPPRSSDPSRLGCQKVNFGAKHFCKMRA